MATSIGTTKSSEYVSCCSCLPTPEHPDGPELQPYAATTKPPQTPLHVLANPPNPIAHANFEIPSPMARTDQHDNQAAFVLAESNGGLQKEHASVLPPNPETTSCSAPYSQSFSNRSVINLDAQDSGQIHTAHAANQLRRLQNRCHRSLLPSLSFQRPTLHRRRRKPARELCTMLVNTPIRLSTGTSSPTTFMTT